VGLILCAGLAGCGGSARHGHATTRHGTPRGVVIAGTLVSTGTKYRWLVTTTGAQPPVGVENRHAGTSAWRLPGPAADVGGLAHGNVIGYVGRQAIGVGETQRIYVSAPGSRTVRIEIFRMGWYGGHGGREVLASRPLRVRAQPRCKHEFETGLTECAWHPTLSFAIPSALASGVYIARLSARTGQSDCLFVVLAARPAPLLAQLPTSTYEAYNAWGGDSLYPGGDRVGLTGMTQGVEVSYQRPYATNTGAGQFFARDVAMVRFLERYGYPVSYTTSESVDQNPSQLAGHRAVLDFGHSEYWSQRQADAFARARDSGTSLLFFGSDTLAWRVRYVPASRATDDPGAPDQTIVAYKEHARLDPDRSEPTGVFPDGGATLTGSAYLGCITPRVKRFGPPTYRYYAWVAPRNPRPAWLFARTGITSSMRIPGIIGYELDMRTSASPRNTQIIGSGLAPCMAAEPGEPRPSRVQHLAQATLYTAPSGALVWGTGTLGWELGLEPVPSASPEAPARPNPYLVAMTRNLLAHVLSARRVG
jgi:hypothetical protein